MSAEDHFTQMYAVAGSAARTVASTYNGFVTVEDLQQEGVLWLLEHPERVENHTLPDGTIHFTGLAFELISKLVRTARREKERAGAVQVERYAYTVRMVELVLPGVFDPTYHPPQTIEGGMPRAATDPASLTNWQAMVADVRKAIDEVCSLLDKRILFTRSVGGWTWAQFGEVYEHSGEWFRLRYHEALYAIAAVLSDGVVMESDGEADAVADALDPTPTAPLCDGEDEDEWHLIGKDPYREPEW